MTSESDSVVDKVSKLKLGGIRRGLAGAHRQSACAKGLLTGQIKHLCQADRLALDRGNIACSSRAEKIIKLV